MEEDVEDVKVLEFTSDNTHQEDQLVTELKHHYEDLIKQKDEMIAQKDLIIEDRNKTISELLNGNPAQDTNQDESILQKLKYIE